MPRVPIAQITPQVEQAPRFTGPQTQIPVPDFGKDLSETGQVLLHLAGVQQRAAQRLQEERDLANSKKGFLQFNELTQTDLSDPEKGGFLTKVGGDASPEARAAALQRMNERVQTIAGSLENDRQRRLFLSAATQRAQDYQSRVFAHEAEQIRVDHIAQTGAMIEQSRRDFVDQLVNGANSPTARAAQGIFARAAEQNAIAQGPETQGPLGAPAAQQPVPGAIGPAPRTPPMETARNTMIDQINESAALHGWAPDDPRRSLAVQEHLDKAYTDAAQQMLNQHRTSDVQHLLDTAGETGMSPGVRSEIAARLQKVSDSDIGWRMTTTWLNYMEEEKHLRPGDSYLPSGEKFLREKRLHDSTFTADRYEAALSELHRREATRKETYSKSLLDAQLEAQQWFDRHPEARSTRDGFPVDKREALIQNGLLEAVEQYAKTRTQTTDPTFYGWLQVLDKQPPDENGKSLWMQWEPRDFEARFHGSLSPETMKWALGRIEDAWGRASPEQLSEGRIHAELQRSAIRLGIVPPKSADAQPEQLLAQNAYESDFYAAMEVDRRSPHPKGALAILAEMERTTAAPAPGETPVNIYKLPADQRAKAGLQVGNVFVPIGAMVDPFTGNNRTLPELLEDARKWNESHPNEPVPQDLQGAAETWVNTVKRFGDDATKAAFDTLPNAPLVSSPEGEPWLLVDDAAKILGMTSAEVVERAAMAPGGVHRYMADVRTPDNLEHYQVPKEAVTIPTFGNLLIRRRQEQQRQAAAAEIARERAARKAAKK